MTAETQRTSGHDPDEEALNFRLPARCRAALDADGTHRGRTWRQMPPGRCNRTLQVLNWWLWKRNLS